VLVGVLAVDVDGAEREVLYVQATLSRDVHLVDANTFEPIGRIYVGDYTDDVIGSPDGRAVFANAQIHNGNPLSHQANHAGKITAFSTETDAILWSTAVEGSPHHLAVSPDGSRLYVPLFDRHYLLEFDAESGQILRRWHAYMGNHGLAVSRDGSKLFVGNMVADLILTFDTASGQPIGMLPAQDAVRPFVLSPDERTIYYQLSRFHGFKVRDVESGKMLKSVELPALGPEVDLPEIYPHTYNHGLARSPDGTKLIAAGSVADFVAVYGLPDLKLLKKIDVGDDPNWIVVRSDSKAAFVTNRGSDELSVIDLEGLTEIKRFKLGDMPQRMNLVRVPKRTVPDRYP
jgi:YVTN family beta-propeller protein